MATQASFGDMPVRDFVAALSAKQPTPGGGAAAALAAALGDASGAMACVYTQRKKDKERGVFDKAKASGDLLTASALSDVAAADADAAAYAALQSTWKKDCALTEAEKDRVAADALAVPVDLLERCYLNARDVAAFVPLCNPNIVSDAKVALHLLAGAARLQPAAMLAEERERSLHGLLMSRKHHIRREPRDWVLSARTTLKRSKHSGTPLVRRYLAARACTGFAAAGSVAPYILLAELLGPAYRRVVRPRNPTPLGQLRGRKRPRLWQSLRCASMECFRCNTLCFILTYIFWRRTVSDQLYIRSRARRTVSRG